MNRVPPVGDPDALEGEAAVVAREIIARRGKLGLPFAVLLNRPALAQAASELGARIRFDSHLSDHDRELATVATAARTGCARERKAHVPLALQAGVRAEVIEAIEQDRAVSAPEGVIVEFVRELCDHARTSDETFDALRRKLGDAGTVELTVLVGYYTMLAYVLNTAESTS